MHCGSFPTPWYSLPRSHAQGFVCVQLVETATRFTGAVITPVSHRCHTRHICYAMFGLPKLCEEALCFNYSVKSPLQVIIFIFMLFFFHWTQMDTMPYKESWMNVWSHVVLSCFIILQADLHSFIFRALCRLSTIPQLCSLLGWISMLSRLQRIKAFRKKWKPWKTKGLVLVQNLSCFPHASLDT